MLCSMTEIKKNKTKKLQKYKQKGERLATGFLFKPVSSE